MRLLLQAWHANDLYDWRIAAAIVAGVVVATLVIKYVALRVVAVLSRRAAHRRCTDAIICGSFGQRSTRYYKGA